MYTSQLNAPAGTDCPVIGVVLAGGQGARLGYRDKGLLPLDGRPAAARAYELLAEVLPRVVIALRRDQLSAYATAVPGAELIPDASPVPGPLGALLSVFAALGSDTDVCVIAADLPLLGPAPLRALLVRAGEVRATHDLLCFTSPTRDTPENTGAAAPRLEPLVAVYFSHGLRAARERVLPAFTGTVAPVAPRAAASLRHLAAALRTATLEINPEWQEQFLNCNTPADMHRLEDLTNHRSGDRVCL